MIHSMMEKWNEPSLSFSFFVISMLTDLARFEISNKLSVSFDENFNLS